MSIEHITKANEPRVDTQLNYAHIAIMISTIFAMGVAYGTINSKLDKVLTTVSRVEVLENRATKLEEVNQGQVFINKNVDERFDRNELNIKSLQEQRPKNF